MPCSGKTSIARQLAYSLRMPLISKDDIKERLFDTLGWSDREWSKKLGGATFELIFYLIQQGLSTGVSLMAEAPFYAKFHQGKLQQMQVEHPFRSLIIECTADSRTLLERFIQRSQSGQRHPGHVDHTSYAEAADTFFGERPRPVELGGRYIQVDTTDFSQVDLPALASAILEELDK